MLVTQWGSKDKDHVGAVKGSCASMRCFPDLWSMAVWMMRSCALVQHRFAARLHTQVLAGSRQNSCSFVHLCMLCAMLLLTLHDQHTYVVQALIKKAGWKHHSQLPGTICVHLHQQTR